MTYRKIQTKNSQNRLVHNNNHTHRILMVQLLIRNKSIQMPIVISIT